MRFPFVTRSHHEEVVGIMRDRVTALESQLKVYWDQLIKDPNAVPPASPMAQPTATLAERVTREHEARVEAQRQGKKPATPEDEEPTVMRRSLRGGEFARQETVKNMKLYTKESRPGEIRTMMQEVRAEAEATMGAVPVKEKESVEAAK